MSINTDMERFLFGPQPKIVFPIHPDVWKQAVRTFSRPENLMRPDVNRHMLQIPCNPKPLRERIRFG